MHCLSSVVLNPATLLPESEGPSLHGCIQVMKEVLCSQPYLEDTHLKESDLEMLTDRSSFMGHEHSWSGHAVATLTEFPNDKPLPIRYIRPEGQTHVLTQVLIIRWSKKMNIYMDSNNAFSAVYACGATRKERELLTTNNKEIKHLEPILNLLGAVLLPSEVAVRHCLGHQQSNSYLAKKES